MIKSSLLSVLLMGLMTVFLSCKSDITLGPGITEVPEPAVCEVCPNLSSQAMCAELTVEICAALDGLDCDVDDGWTVDSCIGSLMRSCASQMANTFDSTKTRHLYFVCLPAVRADTCRLSAEGESALPEVCLELFKQEEPVEEEDINVESI